MPYFRRSLENELKSFIESNEPHKHVLLVEGARQVGKTTLVERMLENLDWPVIAVNLEREAVMRSRIDTCAEFSEFQDLMVDQYGFDPGQRTVVFIDECQESTRLGGFVRFMKELWAHATVILTGSTLSRLFRNTTRYPVGRVRRLQVTPFSFGEFLEAGGESAIAALLNGDLAAISAARHEHLLERLDAYLTTGGLPAAVLVGLRGGDLRSCHQNIRADYEQDFIRLFGEEKMPIVDGCFRGVANFVGGASKHASIIPSPTNREHHIISQVFARLESWMLVLKSSQSGPSPERSHRYLPKRYLFDTGLLKHIREAALPSLAVVHSIDSETRKVLGGIVENQVAIEIRKQFGELTGWKRSPSGGEIDFLIKRQGAMIPVECKAAVRIKGTHIKGIKQYLEQYHQETGAIVSLAPFSITEVGEKTKVVNIPLYAAEHIGRILQGLG